MEAGQDRQEFKFVLSGEQSDLVRARVAKHLQVDQNNPEGYRITSEYFDTGDHHSYWEKQFGVGNRRRIRSRVYGQPDASQEPIAFLEVKHKLDGVTVKRRLLVDLQALDAAAEGKLPEVETRSDRMVRNEIEDMMRHTSHGPVVQIRYQRHAYDSGADGTFRVTFDTDPRCRFTAASLLSETPAFDLELLPPGAAIMEVKVAERVPYWFRQLLGEFNLLPLSFSKYATALERYAPSWAKLNNMGTAFPFQSPDTKKAV